MSDLSDYKLSVSWEMVDEIVTEVLASTRQSWKKDMEKPNHVFVYGDYEADCVEIQKHIDAIELMLKWYAAPDKLQELGLNDD